MLHTPTWCHTPNALAAATNRQLWKVGRAGVEVEAGKKLTGAVSTMMNTGAEGEEATTAAGGEETITAVADAARTHMRFITRWDGASVKVASENNWFRNFEMTQ